MTIKLRSTKEEIRDRMDRYFPRLRYDIAPLGSGRYELSVYWLEENEDDDFSETEVSELFEDVLVEEGAASAEELVSLLKERELIMSTAESCTGGMIAAEIVSVSGASEVFYEGLVTYCNDAKIHRLGVARDTINSFGAVSEETAIEMANGLLNDKVSIGVSVTGIAGPAGGSISKPVGLVYIAVVSDEESDVTRNFFSGSRHDIREQAKDRAIELLIEHIKTNYKDKGVK